MAQETRRIDKQQETTRKDSITHALTRLTKIKLKIDKILINMK